MKGIRRLKRKEREEKISWVIREKQIVGNKRGEKGRKRKAGVRKGKGKK